MKIITTASGRTKRLPDSFNLDAVIGLDPDGRVVVDHFGAVATPIPPAEAYTFRDAPFVFGLTLCCNASDKGTEDGVVCRGCYGAKRNADEGAYIYRAADGSFPGVDPLALKATATIERLAFGVRVTLPRDGRPDQGLISAARATADWTDTRGGTHIAVADLPDGTATVALTHLRSRS